MVTEPDPDQGHVDGPAPDEVALVVPGRHGAVLAELAERALDGVAVLIGGRVGDLRADDFARLTGRQAAVRYPALRGGAGWCLPLSTGASRFLLPVPDGRRIAMGRVDYLLGELGTLSERTLQLTVADLAASSEAGPPGRGAAVTQTALPGLAVLLGLVGDAATHRTAWSSDLPQGEDHPGGRYFLVSALTASAARHPSSRPTLTARTPGGVIQQVSADRGCAWPVSLEYSIAWLIWAIASILDAMMVGCRVLLKIVYLLVRRILSLAVLVFRGDRATDAELFALRHQDAVLRHHVGRVRYEPADRMWFAALGWLIPRRSWAEVFPERACDVAGPASQTGREQVRHEQAAQARPPAGSPEHRLGKGESAVSGTCTPC
jgi:hypothetical protein